MALKSKKSRNAAWLARNKRKRNAHKNAKTSRRKKML